jgi:Arc/MetJ-type ribon-helix-helix transcriptional regulator
VEVADRLWCNPVMQVRLTKPELQRFIDNQVKAGCFPSPEAVVEAAVERMMVDQETNDLDQETADAINRSEDQIDRGEGIDFRRFASEMRKKCVDKRMVSKPPL